MAVAVHLRHTGFTPGKCERVIRSPDAAGHAAPAARYLAAHAATGA